VADHSPGQGSDDGAGGVCVAAAVQYRAERFLEIAEVTQPRVDHHRYRVIDVTGYPAAEAKPVREGLDRLSLLVGIGDRREECQPLLIVRTRRAEQLEYRSQWRRVLGVLTDRPRREVRHRLGAGQGSRIGVGDRFRLSAPHSAWA